MKPVAIIIGLTGPAGCGKDTVGAYAPDFHKYSLACPIRNGLKAMFGIPTDTLLDRKQKEVVIPWLGKSPRELMQTLGTEWGRTHVSDDIWLKLMLRRWEMIKVSTAPYLIVTDVRFDNEAVAIIREGGTIWKVTRPGYTPVRSHTSEAGVSAAHIKGEIANDGTMDDLRRRTRSVIIQCGKEKP